LLTGELFTTRCYRWHKWCRWDNHTEEKKGCFHVGRHGIGLQLTGSLCLYSMELPQGVRFALPASTLLLLWWASCHGCLLKFLKRCQDKNSEGSHPSSYLLSSLLSLHLTNDLTNVRRMSLFLELDTCWVVRCISVSSIEGSNAGRFEKCFCEGSCY